MIPGIISIAPYLAGTPLATSFRAGSSLNEGLVAHYKLNEKSGTTVFDHSLNGLNGTNNGATVKQPGVFNTAYRIGSGSYITAPLTTNSNAISFYFVVKLDSLSPDGGRFFTKNGYVRAWIETNKIRFTRSFDGTDGAWDTPAGSLVAGSTYLVSISHDGTTAQPTIYINGVSKTITTITTPSGSLETSSDQYTIGNREAHDSNIDGVLDTFAIWHKELTAEEHNELLHPYLPTDSFPEGSTLNTGVVAHYKNWNNQIPALVDYSGNGHHGEIYGTPSYIAGVNKYAYDLDGSTDYFRMLDNIFDFERTDSFSFHSKIKVTNQSAANVIASKMNSITNQWRGWSLFEEFGKIGLILRNDNNPLSRIFVKTTSTEISLNTTYDISVTYDGTSSASAVKMYIDGSLVGTTILTDNLTATIKISDIATVGGWYGIGNYFHGTIDNLVVWSKELTASEITELQKPYKVFDYESSLNENLVLSMDFAEMEGTTVFDGSGGGLHGVNSGADVLQDGSYGDERAYAFKSTDSDFITVADDSILDFTGDFTIAILFKSSGFSHDERIFCKGGAVRYEVYVYADTLTFAVDDDVIKSSVAFDASSSGLAGDLDDGNWHVLYIERDYGNLIKIAVDNSAFITASDNTVAIANSSPFYIGRDNSGKYMDALISDIKIFNNTLTADEITELDNFLQGITS